MRALVTLAMVGLAVAGCGSSRDVSSQARPAPAPSGEPTPYPVAFEVPAAVARRLADGDAYETIERAGHVVGATDWEPYFALVLDSWLSERGVEIDAPQYRTVASRVAEEQDLSLLFVTGEHARALARLRPGKRRLERYYERFSEEPLGSAGTGMLEWLEIFREAAESADPRSVVVIRLID